MEEVNLEEVVVVGGSSIPGLRGACGEESGRAAGGADGERIASTRLAGISVESEAEAEASSSKCEELMTTMVERDASCTLFASLFEKVRARRRTRRLYLYL